LRFLHAGAVLAGRVQPIGKPLENKIFMPFPVGGDIRTCIFYRAALFFHILKMWESKMADLPDIPLIVNAANPRMLFDQKKDLAKALVQVCRKSSYGFVLGFLAAKTKR